MSKTIRQYSSDFKHDVVQYVESHLGYIHAGCSRQSRHT